MIVTRGADQVAMSTRYDDRGNSVLFVKKKAKLLICVWFQGCVEKLWSFVG